MALLFEVVNGGQTALLPAPARRANERDAGERGQPVRQPVLEGRLPGLSCGRLPLPVLPVTKIFNTRQAV